VCTVAAGSWRKRPDRNMAFPKISTIIDPFTRANANNLGTNWSQVAFGGGNGPAIIGNQVGPDEAGDFSFMYWNQTTFGVNAEAFIDIVTKHTVDDNDSMQIGLIQSGSPFNGYLVAAEILAAGDVLKVVRYDAGVGTLLGSTVAQEITNGDAIGIRRTGNDIQIWHRTGGTWSLKAVRTDSAYAGPWFAGFYASDTSSGAYLYDNFGGGMLTPIWDHFDRADENPLAYPWATSTGDVVLQLSGNMVRGTVLESGGNHARYSPHYVQNQKSTITVVTLGTGCQAMPCARMSSSNVSFYLAYVEGPFSATTNCVLSKFVNGSFSNIATGSNANLASGGTVSIDCQRETIRMLVNDVQIYSVTDGSIARGSPGMGVYVPAASALANCEIDDWHGEYDYALMPRPNRLRPRPFAPGLAR
jgi:hypothetical protein